MAILCLPPPASPPDKDRDFEAAVERRSKWLQCVEDLVRKIVLGGEGRMWLCAALGSLDLPPAAQKAAFLGLVSADGDEGRSVRQRVVRMLCESRPGWAARVIARDDRLLRRFFEGDSQRILQWFGKFSSSGTSDHQWGARALARFTFVHRESCWQELDWNGKHGQAPATVASKPYYFLELDVLRTIDNFLDKVPSFWKSDELWESMKDGEFISLDVDFFVNELVEKMMIDDCPETWNLVEDYLADESLPKLSNCVLHLLTEESLLTFVNELVFQMSTTKGSERKGGGQDIQRSWLPELISSRERCVSLDDAIVCNACANHQRQIMKIFGDEDHEEESNGLKRLFAGVESDPAVVWAVRSENLKLDKWSCLKFLGLEALMLYGYLTEMSSQISYPRLFRENRIRSDAAPMTPRKRKKKKSKRNRKESEDSGGSSSDGGGGGGGGGIDQSWRLCTDNFRFLWRKEDLPEHLSCYAFEEWVKWTIAHW